MGVPACRVVWNCPALRLPLPLLSYQCPEVWWTMGETADPNIRHCDTCNNEVHLCRTPEEFVEATVQGHCVGIPFEFRPINLLAIQVGQPSVESAAEFREQLRSVVQWWDSVIKGVPEALGTHLEHMLATVERRRDEVEPEKPKG